MAVGNPVTLLSLPIVTNVVMQSSAAGTAWVVLAIASGAGFAAWASPAARQVRNSKERRLAMDVQMVHLTRAPARADRGRNVKRVAREWDR